jgi:hypothetical protein
MPLLLGCDDDELPVDGVGGMAGVLGTAGVGGMAGDDEEEEEEEEEYDAGSRRPRRFWAAPAGVAATVLLPVWLLLLPASARPRPNSDSTLLSSSSSDMFFFKLCPKAQIQFLSLGTKAIIYRILHKVLLVLLYWTMTPRKMREGR